MASKTVNWEDDENNRLVELSVEYRVDNNQVVVEQVTPAAITFAGNDSQPARRLRVWTEAGRALLRRQHAQSNHDLNASLESQA